MIRCFLFAALCSSSIVTALPIGNPAAPQLLRNSAFPERFEPRRAEPEGVQGGISEIGETVLDKTELLATSGSAIVFTALSSVFPFIPSSGELAMEIGYYGDFVFQRNLFTKFGDVTSTRFYTNAAEISVTLDNFISLFTTLGATQHYFETTGFSIVSFIPAGPAFRILFDTTRNFSWSVGTRISAFTWDRFSLGIEAQYFRTATSLDSFMFEPFVPTNPTNVPFWYGEWQVGLGLGRTWEIIASSLQLSPYLGIKFSGARAKIPLITFKSNKLVGYALGASLAVGKAVSVNVEGRWADESAVFVNGRLSY